MLEIVTPIPAPKRVRTTSELSTFLNCRRKYELRNVKRLRPTVTKRWSAFGTAFHRFDELYHSGESPEAAIAKVRSIFFGDDITNTEHENAWEGFVQIALGYANEYPVRPRSAAGDSWVEEVISGLRFRADLLEVPFKIPIFTPGGRRSAKAEYAGIFDGIVEDEDGGLWLYETKTAANLTEAFFDKLGFDRQVLRYVYAARLIFGSRKQVKGVLYSAVSKTAPRAPETRQDGSLSTAAVVTSPSLLAEALAAVRWLCVEKAGATREPDLQAVVEIWDLALAVTFVAHTLDVDTTEAWGALEKRAQALDEGKPREAAQKKVDKAKADQAKYRDLAETAAGRLFYARRFREIGNDVLEEVQWELYQLDRDVQLAEQEGRFYPNDRACDQMGGCEYRDLCLKGIHDGFVEQPVRHTELPPEGFLMPSNPRPIRSALADVLKALESDQQLEAE
jgi:hypothetical protein